MGTVYTDAERLRGLLVLVATGGNANRAAIMLEMPRPTLLLWRHRYAVTRGQLAWFGLSPDDAQRARVRCVP
jgi:hypothetical protein